MLDPIGRFEVTTERGCGAAGGVFKTTEGLFDGRRPGHG